MHVFQEIKFFSQRKYRPDLDCRRIREEKRVVGQHTLFCGDCPNLVYGKIKGNIVFFRSGFTVIKNMKEKRKIMKVALYSTRKEWKTYMKTGFHMYRENLEPLEVDYFHSDNPFWTAVQKKRYDLIVIDKPTQDKMSWGRFLQALDRLCRELIKDNSRHVWNFRRKMIVLEKQEIYYLFSVQKAVRVYGKNNSYQISTTMKLEEERLADKGFLRIHRNCLVNLMHVKTMDGRCLVMRNGTRLLISFRKKSQVKQQLLQLNEKGRKDNES